TDLTFRPDQRLGRPLVVGGGNGERHIGCHAVAGDVLHDHVDVDIGFGKRAEDGGRDAGLVLYAADRDLRLVLREGDAGDDLLFHDLLLATDKRSGRRAVRIDILRLLEARTHEDAHIMHHSKLDRAYLQNLGAERREFQHFLIGDALEALRARHDARIAGVDAVDVGVDVAALRRDGG